MEAVLILVALFAFGALSGRWWALIAVSVPFAAVAAWLAAAGDIPDHDVGTIRGTDLALVVVAAGAMGAIACSLGVILGSYFKERRRPTP